MTFTFKLTIQCYKVGDETRYMVRCLKSPTMRDEPPAQYSNEGGRNFGAIMQLVTQWLLERMHA
jgi:hypothetical protein